MFNLGKKVDIEELDADALAPADPALNPTAHFDLLIAHFSALTAIVNQNAACLRDLTAIVNNNKNTSTNLEGYL